MLRQYEFVCLLFSPTVVGRFRYIDTVGNDERMLTIIHQLLVEQIQDDIGIIIPPRLCIDFFSGTGGAFKVFEPYD